MGKKSKAAKTEQPETTKDTGKEMSFEVVEDEQRESESDEEWLSAGNKNPVSTGHVPVTRSQAKKGKKVEVIIEEEKQPEPETKPKKQSKKAEGEKQSKDKTEKKKKDDVRFNYRRKQQIQRRKRMLVKVRRNRRLPLKRKTTKERKEKMPSLKKMGKRPQMTRPRKKCLPLQYNLTTNHRYQGVIRDRKRKFLLAQVQKQSLEVAKRKAESMRRKVIKKKNFKSMTLLRETSEIGSKRIGKQPW